MSSVQKIERSLLTLVGSFSLRPTLDRAVEIGDLLLDARPLIPHGDWIPWLHRIGLKRQTAHDYICVAEHKDEIVRPAGQLGIKGFIRAIRHARNAARRKEMEQNRAVAAGKVGKLADGITLAHCDCRKYLWGEYDFVCTDPPWADMDAYKWLADMAADHLREGGLLLVQAGQPWLPEVMTMLGQRLTYIWTFAAVFNKPTAMLATGRFSIRWRPVLVYSKGRAKFKEHLTDIVLVPVCEKDLHPWQQPMMLWKFWLEYLVKPGQCVADPFAGAGTIGMVCKELGVKYVGTEKDREHYKVARGRLKI